MTEREALMLALEVMRNQGDVSVDEWIATEKAIKEVLALPEQHQDWCASLTQMLASMPPKQAPCNCKPEPVIDKSAAVRIATSLGWEPKRTWVGLTEQEREKLRWQALEEDAGYTQLIKATEAKLREKNA